MDLLIEANRWFHIIVGFTGLAAWWVPVLTKKGGKQHVFFGKLFALSAYIIGTTALAGVSMRMGYALWQGIDVTQNPETFGFLIFLAYLGVVTIGITHQAVRVIRTRNDPDSIRTPFLKALAVLMGVGSLAVVTWAVTQWSSVSPVLLALSPVGLLGAHGIYKYMYHRPPEKMAWWYEHMGAMLGAGIAFHTAFLVFGSRVVIDLQIFGAFNWVPWVLPAVIGTIGGSYWEKFYRRKFGDLPSDGAANA
ncbi:MAG: hypothetical protein GKS06_05410 [Acidobacteria bacterium]|nr:hypothetical protein [Acidobacteriota bacterium]